MNPSPESTDLETLKREAEGWIEWSIGNKLLAGFIRRLLDAVEGLEKERDKWESEARTAETYRAGMQHLEETLAQERQKVEALQHGIENFLSTADDPEQRNSLSLSGLYKYFGDVLSQLTKANPSRR